MNVLLLTSHSIAEYDDLRMLSDLGYDVFSIGAYTDPRNPTDDKRPALPDVTYHPLLAERCDQQRAKMAEQYGDPGRHIDWAKARIHPDVLAWADAVIVHHFPESWIAEQWPRFQGKRVIWRTCGQSSPDGSLERLMGTYRRQGLGIVRYSPKERNLPDYAGEDAVIRFGKYPADFEPWIGDRIAVGNVTQHMAQRGDACGYGFWLRATNGLPTQPAGPGSEALGGLGELTYVEMLDYLRHIRVYLYTGTQPASYTLGLMEAMFAGTPVISIADAAFGVPSLFEGVDIVEWAGGIKDSSQTYDDIVRNTKSMLSDKLRFQENAQNHSRAMRERAIELFDVAVVGPQWKAFLG